MDDGHAETSESGTTERQLTLRWADIDPLRLKLELVPRAAG
jgi:hypothetical protein